MLLQPNDMPVGRLRNDNSHVIKIMATVLHTLTALQKSQPIYNWWSWPFVWPSGPILVSMLVHIHAKDDTTPTLLIYLQPFLVISVACLLCAWHVIQTSKGCFLFGKLLGSSQYRKPIQLFGYTTGISTTTMQPRHSSRGADVVRSKKHQAHQK